MSKEEMSTLGHNNYNKAKDLFDKETNINKYLKLYKQMIKLFLFFKQGYKKMLMYESEKI